MQLPALKKIITYFVNEEQINKTLLAVCPNSESVTRAALLAAKEANAPMLFAATLNQVDRDGGYTGWTPSELTDFISRETDRIGLESPVYTCLDHGGPWLKDKHTSEKLSFEETMAEVKITLEACIDAGYELLHIDPTVDIRLGNDDPIPIDLVVERTLDMIEHAETYRKNNNLPPISYEVGTEEVHGGLANMESFDQFLTSLDEGLKEKGLEDAWPCFVVGKVGTDLHTSLFDPEVAKNLTSKVKPYGALIKGHYSDYVDNPEDYPLSGMGGANVGPEYTEEEFIALMELVKLEQKIGKDSGLTDALKNAVIDSNRWQKWLSKEEKGKDFEDLSDKRQLWLMRTCSRYIWTSENVQESRKKLYANLEGVRDADAFVIWHLKKSIMKYYHNFNLINFSSDHPELVQ
ncbi:class II D-tagatose-bisphosphate aldolase non-catalytic subunit [Rhodohalobacter sp. 614A]|uniref:class II D-tagatose-bisphosphate aldolase non-catalytic subunit n=1 Tax=Rhodohalobacter sp. 614A TaxID=2908649 RepID=UPI001F213FBC|nr:class II D-tagatose-bisphosphate aldolase, non-catalytic subunit [Rhodohalobacter sp. 614A]